MTKPADFPPPFRAAEYITAPSDPEDERIEVGVLIVGAGPAGLACAIRLGQLLEYAPEIRERLGDVPVAVLDKGKQPGSPHAAALPSGPAHGRDAAGLFASLDSQAVHTSVEAATP